MDPTASSDIVVANPHKSAITRFRPGRALPALGAAATTLWIGARTARAIWKLARGIRNIRRSNRPQTRRREADGANTGRVVFYYERREVAVYSPQRNQSDDDI